MFCGLPGVVFRLPVVSPLVPWISRVESASFCVSFLGLLHHKFVLICENCWFYLGILSPDFYFSAVFPFEFYLGGNGFTKSPVFIFDLFIRFYFLSYFLVLLSTAPIVVVRAMN